MTKKNTLIQYYMMDEKYEGCIKCSMRYSTVVAYKFPYNVVAEFKNMNALKGSGVYILFGENREGKRIMYVGQASSRKNGNGLGQRMCENHDTIPEWSEAMVLTTVDGKMGATELEYLEHAFYCLAINAGRCIVVNKNEPACGKITEEEECELKKYLSQAMAMLKALSCKELVKVTDKLQNTHEELFYLRGYDYDARACYTSEGFVVLEESVISPIITPSCPDGAKHNREQYADLIIDGKLTEAIIFKSPSGAASFVCGSSTNGMEKWKTAVGQSLKAYMDSHAE